MAIFSWRSLVWSTVASLSVVAGLSDKAQACCFSWLGGAWMGDCCGGPYSAGYGVGYGRYYGGGYSGGYAPSYDTCGGCGPSYGYGGSYSNAGCAPCSGPGCGISAPPANPTKPTPDDGFRNADPNSSKPDERSRRRTPPTYKDEESPATSGGSARSKSDSRDDVSDGTQDRTLGAPDSTPDTEFDVPLRRRRGENASDPFPSKSDKVPMPDADDSKVVPDPNDDVPAGNDDKTSTETKTNRPDLGPSTEGDDAGSPADAAAGQVIPQKKPAPTVEIPPEEDAAPEADLPENLNQDDKPTSAGTAPKTRLALTGRYGTPSIVRLRLRPGKTWLANPQQAPVLAKH